VNSKNKRHLILEQIGALFEMHQNYRLYTTGHSLGMALATLLAAEAASL
jgi:putative lipase involved disintegration of autophagic bodies